MNVEGAEYPSALWMPAHSSNFRRVGRMFRFVIIHCTDGRAKARPVAEMWQTPNHGSSAHFVIGQDGEIVQAISVLNVAFHAHAMNRLSVGIEHCCRTPGELGKDDPGLPPSEVQLAASARLTAFLCGFAGLPVTRETIRGHAESDPASTHRGCPTSGGIRLDDYVARVAGLG